MVKQTSDAAAIAAFIAKRGVTKIPAGAAALGHMTSRDWHKANRDTATVQARTEQDAINDRYYITDNAGVEHCRNGLGEWLY